jgi:4-oxalocrotonate tautomerase
MVGLGSRGFAMGWWRRWVSLLCDRLSWNVYVREVRSSEFPKIIMPYVNIQITEGATREQKSQLVQEVTDSLVRILGKKPEHIHIVIQEIAEADWGFVTLK